MRTKWFGIGMVIAALVMIAVNALAAQEGYPGTQFEYALAVVDSEHDQIGIAIRDRAEREAVEAIIDEMPEESRTLYNVHNVMGLAGWELVQIDYQQGVPVATYKRVKLGTG